MSDEQIVFTHALDILKGKLDCLKIITGVQLIWCCVYTMEFPSGEIKEEQAAQQHTENDEAHEIGATQLVEALRK